MKVELNGFQYEVVKNYRDGFLQEEVELRTTDYFNEYDYIFGDWSYGKLRLKGFYKDTNKKVKAINNIKHLEKYIKENCAFDCRYFLLEKN